VLTRRACITLGLVLGCGALWLGMPAPAGAGWAQPWSGVGPTSGGINQSTSDTASATSLAEVDGLPWVAWSEANQLSRTNSEVRVARFNPSANSWEQPWIGVGADYGGLNQSPTRFGLEPRLTTIGGVPYVAWHEHDGTNFEVRVARLSASAWQQSWDGVGATSGAINQATDRGGTVGDLEDVGGVPHVAWLEHDGTNFEVRVARLNASTNEWEQPWSGVSGSYGGINQSSSRDASYEPHLSAIDGIPYVSWTEFDGTNAEVRVARLVGSSWEQPWSGAGPTSGGVNQSTDRSADRPTLGAVDGTPYMAWEEDDGSLNRDIRVARLDASTSAWEQPWSGVSPTYGGVTQSSEWGGVYPSMIAVGAVPYVAWEEFDGANLEMRVARLDSSSNTWQQPWSGVTDSYGGINQSTDQLASRPSLTAVGGVPFVAWEEPEGFSVEARVARLEPEHLSLAAQPSARGATLTATTRTFGVPFPIGFQFGARLESETPTETPGPASDVVTVTRQVGGLRPATAYRYRPFAIAGVPAPKAFGPIDAFTTSGSGTPDAPPPADTKAPQTRLRRHPPKRTRKRRATFRFSSTEPGSIFECRLDRRRFRRCKSPKTVKVKPGRHAFEVRARDAAGNVDRSPARFTWTILKRKRRHHRG
jgi:hypothetical protein